MTYSVRRCPACDKLPVRATVIFRQQFAKIEGVSILNGYDVAACEDCGMTFAENVPAQSAFDTYYANASKYEFTHHAGAESPYDNARLRIVADTIAAKVPDKAARILDIGCSTGQLLRELRSRGYTTLSGLDPSPACVNIAKQRDGLAVQLGTIESLEVGQFDVIIMVGVLEHLRDVQRLLAIVRARLAPGGRLYLEVPDAARFGVHPNAPFQEFSVEHINYFSAWSLATTLRTAGFNPQWFDGTEERHQSATVVMPTLVATAYAAPDVFGPRKCEVSAEAIRQYVADCEHEETRMAGIRGRIAALVASQEPVILWGVGTRLLRLLATTQLAKANIMCVVDANAAYRGREVCGRRIMSPIEFDGRHGIFGPATEATILITSVPFEHEIRAMIAGRKFLNPVGTL